MKKIIAITAIIFTLCLAIFTCITHPNAATDKWRGPFETQTETIAEAPNNCVAFSEETTIHDIVTAFDETADETTDETSNIQETTADEITEVVNDPVSNDSVETTTNTVTEMPVVHKCNHFWRTEYIPETRTESGCLFNSCLHCGEMYIVQIIPALSTTE